MARQLLINADDYGYVDHIDEAIIEAAVKGVVTSISCFANGQALDEKVSKLIEACPNAKIGLHVTVTSGRPLTVCPTLSVDGQFKECRDYRFSESRDELRAEIEAQIVRLEEVLGAGRINHVDCHHNLLYLDFGFFETFLDLAEKYNLPMRSPIRTDLIDRFDPVKALNPALLMPSVLEALKVRPRRNFFRLLYAVKKETTSFLTNKILQKSLKRSDYLTMNIYGNSNLEVLQTVYPLVADGEICEQIMHLSRPTNKKERKNAVNGINPKYFSGRNEEFQLLMSDAFAALLIHEQHQPVPLVLV